VPLRLGAAALPAGAHRRRHVRQRGGARRARRPRGRRRRRR
ncbi:MAG: hypothetical protein AVDCRST_MAG40-919, partial [uncultured Gemmatimonadaceae bacterium]